MRVSQIYFHDPYTGKETSDDGIPRLGEVVVQRRYNATEPKVLAIVTEPVGDYLARNRVIETDGQYETLGERVRRLATCG